MNADRSRIARPVAVAAAIVAALAASLVWAQDRVALVLTIDGAVGPAVADYMDRGLEAAAERGAALVVLRMDTPGGLDAAMRDIIGSILASPIPVAAWVAPEGARAASAGTYILYASHIAAMAPTTHLGAATPVRIGGGGFPSEEPTDDGGDPQDPSTAMERKAVNDAVAYIRGLAVLRGRNADWAERAVREAATLTAAQAMDMDVIDLIARDLDGLLRALDGRTVTVGGAPVVLDTDGLTVERLDPDWRTRVLAILTDPNVAYILMLLGFYGIVYEFLNPGALVPGVAGAICLLLALFAFQALPINYAGLGLIGLGLAFMIAEAFIPSFGALGIGGVIAFAIGSVILFDYAAPGFALAWPVIAAVTLVTAGGMFATLGLMLAGRNRPVVSGRRAMVGSRATVVALSSDGTASVRAHGEIWRARPAAPVALGQSVRIDRVEGLTLVVSPLDEPPTKGE